MAECKFLQSLASSCGDTCFSGPCGFFVSGVFSRLSSVSSDPFSSADVSETFLPPITQARPPGSVQHPSPRFPVTGQSLRPVRISTPSISCPISNSLGRRYAFPPGYSKPLVQDQSFPGELDCKAWFCTKCLSKGFLHFVHLVGLMLVTLYHKCPPSHSTHTSKASYILMMNWQGTIEGGGIRGNQIQSEW